MFKRTKIAAMDKLSGSLTNPGIVRQYLLTGTMTSPRFAQILSFLGTVSAADAPATSFPNGTGLSSYGVGASVTPDGAYAALGCWNSSPLLGAVQEGWSDVSNPNPRYGIRVQL